MLEGNNSLALGSQRWNLKKKLVNPELIQLDILIQIIIEDAGQ